MHSHATYKNIYLTQLTLSSTTIITTTTTTTTTTTMTRALLLTTSSISITLVTTNTEYVSTMNIIGQLYDLFNSICQTCFID